MVSHRTAYIFLILTSILWGGNAVVGKVLSSSIEPMTMVFLRWFPASILFIPLSYKYMIKHKQVLLEHWKLFFSQGLTGMVFFPFLLYWGLQTSTALNASLIVSISPAIIVFANHFLGIESLNIRNVFYSFLSFVGVSVLLTKGELGSLKNLQFVIGDLILLGASLFWTSYILLSKYTPKGIHPFAIIQTQMITVAILSVILMLSLDGLFILSIQWTPQSVLSIAYLVIGTSLLSYYFFTHGTTTLGSLISSVFINLVPVTASILSITLLGETLYMYHFISGAILAISVYKLIKKPA